jgi:hypothetical protein
VPYGQEYGSRSFENRYQEDINGIHKHNIRSSIRTSVNEIYSPSPVQVSDSFDWSSFTESSPARSPRAIFSAVKSTPSLSNIPSPHAHNRTKPANRGSPRCPPRGSDERRAALISYDKISTVSGLKTNGTDEYVQLRRKRDVALREGPITRKGH